MYHYERHTHTHTDTPHRLAVVGLECRVKGGESSVAITTYTPKRARSWPLLPWRRPSSTLDSAADECSRTPGDFTDKMAALHRFWSTMCSKYALLAKIQRHNGDVSKIGKKMHGGLSEMIILTGQAVLSCQRARTKTIKFEVNETWW